MSLRARRDSLLKSSISIKSMRDSVAKFNKGLNAAKKSAFEIVKNTKESNLFKRTLISSDNNFFRKRQENIRRKDREDEIEAVSLSGAVKQKGAILAKSTRGFLGRLLDFVGILLIGWAVTNLPKIIAALSGLINLIRRVTKILGTFVNAIKDIIAGIGSVISEALSKIPFFDYQKNKKGIEENIEKTSGGLARLDQQLVQTGNEFTDFGDEMDQILEDEKTNSQNVEGTKNTSTENQKEGDVEQIKEQSEKIGFGVDQFIKNNKKEDEKNPEQEEDLIKNIKYPTPSSNELSLNKIKDPKEEAKKILESKLNEQNLDGEKIVGDGISDTLKGKSESTPTLIAEKPKQTELSDAKGRIENIQKTVKSEFVAFTGDMNLEDLKMPEKNMKPLKKDKSTTVRSRRKKSGNTIFLIEKLSEMSPTPMMASSGGKSFNIQQQVSKEKILMNLQSASSLKYT